MDNEQPIIENSLFFDQLEVDKLPVKVSYLFLEVFTKAMTQNQEASVEEALAITLLKIGYNLKDLNEDQAETMVGRLLKFQQEEVEALARITEEANKSSIATGGKGKSFGQDYLEYFKEMSNADKCLVACNYDYERARVLYCETDKDIADAVLSKYMETRWQELKTIFEAAVFGFGGSIGGKKDDGPAFDMTSKEGSEAAANQLRALGF